MADELWAVCAYFNPQGYRRRRENYRVFRERLSVPLVTVESSHRDYDLSEPDAEILVQIPSRDVMWQKERLLNIGLKRIPRSCTKLVWIDCDVVFGEEDWVQAVTDQLEKVPLLQPFSRAYYLKPTSRNVPGTSPADYNEVRDSFVSYYDRNRDDPCAFTVSGYSAIAGYSPGFAWACRREILDRHGLYDRMIMGTGDKSIVAAAFGKLEEFAFAMEMSDAQRCDYFRWAEPFYQSVQGQVGVTQNTLYHLWHGDLVRRKYANRYQELSRFRFDPAQDIVEEDQYHSWRWNSGKADMHEFVRGYFEYRREDG